MIIPFKQIAQSMMAASCVMLCVNEASHARASASSISSHHSSSKPAKKAKKQRKNHIVKQTTSIITAASLESPVEIIEKKLLKGSKLWFVKNQDLEIITISLNFKKAGEASEAADKPGVAALCAQVLSDCGTTAEDRVTFQKKLLEKNISIEVSSGLDTFNITMQAPTRNLQEAISILKMLIISPHMENTVIELSKQKIMASLQQALFDPEEMAMEGFKAHIWGENHNYTKTTHTKIEMLPKLKEADLMAFYTSNLKASMLDIAAFGNADENILTEELSKITDALIEGVKEITKSNGEILHQGEFKKIFQDIPQSVVIFAHPSIDRSHPDYYPTMMLIYILGKTPFESRLWQEVREKRGLSYGMGLDLLENDHKFALIGSLATTPTSVDQAIQVIKTEWKKAAEQGITQEELSLHKQYIIGGYPMAFNTSGRAVRVLLNYMAFGYDIHYPKLRNSKFNEVTLEDVNRVAKQFLKENALTFVVYGKSN